MPTAYILRVERGPDAGRDFPLDGAYGLIGREAGAPVALTGGGAAPRHALVSVRDGNLVLTDLGAPGGTRVNGRPVSGSVILHPGDLIAIGETELRVVPVAVPSRRPAVTGAAASHTPRTDARIGRRAVIGGMAAGFSLAALGGALAIRRSGGGEATATPMLAGVAAGGGATASATSPATATTAASTPTAVTAAAVNVPATAVQPPPTPQPTPTLPATATPTLAPAADRFGYPTGGRYSTLDPVGRRGGTVVEVGFADARTNNPLLTADTQSSARIGLQFLSLLGVSPDTGLPFPDLAAEVPTRRNGGISPDGLTYTFTLRKDVRWHDGTPFTSRDVVFTYETLARPELGSSRTAEVADRIAAVSAPDEHTVVFRLKKAVAPFLTDNVAGPGYGIVPRHILGPVPPAEMGAHPFSLGDPQASIGTGPFRMGEWRKGEVATLVKNPAYFRGEPAIDRYVFRTVKDTTAVYNSLRAGESDWGLLSPAFLDEMAKVPGVATVVYDAYSFEYAGFQLDPARTTLFADRRVRQALAWALDREAMIGAVYSGLGTIARGTMPTPSWAYAPERIRTTYTHDPRRAEALLDEAGWRRGADGVRAKDGRPLRFTLWTNAGGRAREALAAAMSQQWRAIGVEATPRSEEWNAYLTRLTGTRDFEMFVVGFGWGIDPDQSSMWATGSYAGGFNLGRYANPEVDRLLAEALAEPDVEKREPLYIELQNILLDDVPAILLVFPQTVAAVNRRLHNCRPNAINTRWNAHLWWVEDGR